jgi:AcrR family transcriptional regulator
MAKSRQASPVTRSERPELGPEEAAARQRILEAAFVAFTTSGYVAASMLEIATRARVSKRELYTLVGNKQQMLVACIETRSRRLQIPADLPRPENREMLMELLATFGTQLVREVSDPTIVAVFRLAVAEAVNAPEVPRALDTFGRGAARNALRKIMTEAIAGGLIEGRPAELAEEFSALLWGDLLVGLLLGVATQPNAREMTRRGRDAATAFLELHAAPKA